MSGITGRGPAKRRSLEIVVEPEVGFDALSDALRRIGELQGCTACGFGGFDVLLRGVKASRPERLREQLEPAVKELEGIQGISDVRVQGIR